MAEFVARPDVRALPSLGVCAVAACARQLPTSGETYCATHLIRLRRARRGRGEVDDEARWRATESPVTRAGHAVLVALPVLVVVQVLFGVQQRAGEGVRTRDPVLRWICDELRRQQVSTVADAVAPGDTERRGAINSLIKHARRGLLNPETEIDKDEWDMTVFGHRGNMSFAAITQDWLRATAKAWASHDLPRSAGHLRRRQDPPPHHQPGPVVAVAATPPGPGTRPGRVGAPRHRGLPGPTGLPGGTPEDQQPDPASGLHRGPRGPHPAALVGADRPRCTGRRAQRRVRAATRRHPRPPRAGRTQP